MFKDGQYVYKCGTDKFTVAVVGGKVFISPEHPVFVKTSDIFNPANYKEVKENG